MYIYMIIISVLVTHLRLLWLISLTDTIFLRNLLLNNLLLNVILSYSHFELSSSESPGKIKTCINKSQKRIELFYGHE